MGYPNSNNSKTPFPGRSRMNKMWAEAFPDWREGDGPIVGMTTAERQQLLAAYTADQTRYLINSTNQSLDLSDPANFVIWRTGGNWDGTYTITLNNKSATYSSKIVFSNNSGYDQFITNGSNNPVDFPDGFDPFRLHKGEVLVLTKDNLGQLVKSVRAWETSSSRIFPFGGTTGQAVRKISDNDSHFGWADDPKAEFVEDATVGSAAEINAIRDALVAAGLMNAS